MCVYTMVYTSTYQSVSTSVMIFFKDVSIFLASLLSVCLVSLSSAPMVVRMFDVVLNVG